MLILVELILLYTVEINGCVTNYSRIMLLMVAACWSSATKIYC